MDVFFDIENLEQVCFSLFVKEFLHNEKSSVLNNRLLQILKISVISLFIEDFGGYLVLIKFFVSTSKVFITFYNGKRVLNV